MIKIGTSLIIIALVMISFIASENIPVSPASAQDNGSSDLSRVTYAGSVSCRKCHEKFYQLWVPSHHGLAMQPYNTGFAHNNLTPQIAEIRIGKAGYQADISENGGWVMERTPQGETKYTIDHVMGGKNVYYFLTAMDRGKFQTLPLAYDVNSKEWLDTAASGVRHVRGRTEDPAHWTDRQYTFNTACYSCHVSQVTTNYDLKTDTYHTVWKEPGINCETCHGSAEEHVRVCEAAPKGNVPKDLKIIRGGRDFTPEQNNATCSACHARANIITEKFQPGDKFFDHYGLVTLENSDYYPDGRDLGENYTYTSWLMSPCVKSGKLDCLHCHTSSGRYKFKEAATANNACMPCHKDKVDNSTQHTNHKMDSPGNKCISCHMPMTEFARMRRSDHSMLPPTPATTIAFESPNACNLCHKDKSPQWADAIVRTWRKRDYQAPILHRAGLIDAARKQDWSKLSQMLDYLQRPDKDVIFAVSLIRLVSTSGEPGLLPVLLKTANDPSPLVRSAAVVALQSFPSESSFQALLDATGDEYRLVRVRAAASLAPYQQVPLTAENKKKREAADKEYLDSILSRPDQWDSHYNLGNYHLDSGNLKQAVDAYKIAIKLEPNTVLPLVNEAIAHARMGKNQEAMKALESALAMSHHNPAVHFNMGLLKAEQNDAVSAEKHLRASLKADPKMDQAAYNLCLLLLKTSPDESLEFCATAVKIRPNQPKYLYTQAFLLNERGNPDNAAAILQGLTKRHPAYVDPYLLLARILQKQGKWNAVEDVYTKALAVPDLPEEYKDRIRALLHGVKTRQSRQH